MYDVLLAADLCLLPGLKRQCSTFMAQNIDCDNVIVLLETARFFDLVRLEDACFEFLAEHLDKVSGAVILFVLIKAAFYSSILNFRWSIIPVLSNWSPMMRRR